MRNDIFKGYHYIRTGQSRNIPLCVKMSAYKNHLIQSQVDPAVNLCKHRNKGKVPEQTQFVTSLVRPFLLSHIYTLPMRILSNHCHTFTIGKPAKNYLWYRIYASVSCRPIDLTLVLIFKYPEKSPTNNCEFEKSYYKHVSQIASYSSSQ